MLSSLIRCKIRSGLIRHGQLTCSELVRTMGLDPARHKGTIHGFMLDLERAGILNATRKNGKRHLWSINQIRKRDRIASWVMA
jgi:predicted transcriptional regulator